MLKRQRSQPEILSQNNASCRTRIGAVQYDGKDPHLPPKKLNWAALGAIALFIGFFWTLSWVPLVILTLIAAYGLTIYSFTLKRRERITAVIAALMMIGMTHLLIFVFAYNRAVG